MKDKTILVASLNEVSKEYGRSQILKKININIFSNNSSGDIIGCVGSNGAGKTTLLRILAGLELQTSGEVFIPNEGLKPGAPAIGIVMENAPFVDYLSGYKNLELLAFIKNITTPKEIKKAIERVGLNPEDKKKVKHYSYGMRQRLALAQAIMESPRLLLLDEPTNGLDAGAIIELRDILIHLAKEQGVAIFMSSHHLTELEKVCDRILMINNGQIVKIFYKNAIGRKEILIEVSSIIDMERLKGWCDEKLKNINILSDIKASIISGMETPETLESLIDFGVRIESITKQGPSLEDEFISLLVNGETNARLC